MILAFVVMAYGFACCVTVAWFLWIRQRDIDEHMGSCGADTVFGPGDPERLLDLQSILRWPWYAIAAVSLPCPLVLLGGGAVAVYSALLGG